MAQSITPDQELPTILQEKIQSFTLMIKLDRYFNESRQSYL